MQQPSTQTDSVSEPADEPAVRVQGLKKRYGSVQAVGGVSFDVAPGTIFGMLGPNGAGKTTTVEMLEGLRDPDEGSIRVLGMDALQCRQEVKERIGVSLQSPALFPRLTVYEVLDLFGSFYDHARPPDRLIELLGLQESRNKQTKFLSGGQQQRLSVALALVNEPEIAFLDEPTTGLDPQARINLWSVIEGVRDAGRTVFLTTHYLDEAERLCDQVAIVDHGLIIALGSPRSLIAENFQETAIIFHLPSPPMEELKALPGVMSVSAEGDEVTLYSRTVPETMAALLDFGGRQTQRLESLYVRKPTLEDVFLKLTGSRLRD
jgi:ABC-2 type transport system ATP-binding protein